MKRPERVCRIVRLGRRATVTGLPKRLRALFQTHAIVPELMADGSIRLRESSRSMLNPTGRRDEFELMPGLVPILTEMLTASGIRVEPDTDRRVWPEAKLAHTEWFKHGHPQLLAAIAERPELLARYRSGSVRLADVFAEICRFFADRRIVIVVSRKDAARALAKQLRSLGIHAEWSSGAAWIRMDRARVWVVTHRGQWAVHVELEWAHILIAADALEFLANQSIERALGAHRARLVGFLTDQSQPSQWQRDWLLQLFGPSPVRVSTVGPVRDVHVVRVRVEGPAIPNESRGAALKRAGIWNHKSRNRRIKGIVAMLCSRDRRDLRERFPKIADALHQRDVSSIAIFVDSAEHAIALANLLPDAQLMTREVAPAGACGAARAARAHVQWIPSLEQQPAAEAAPTVWIVTANTMQLFFLGSCQVLIRADGGTGLPPGMTDESLAMFPDSNPLILVDFDDRHHRDLRRRCWERVVAYAHAGWMLADSHRNALASFLATRPPGGRSCPMS